MTHLCPACGRAFGEPGFCPFDRATLIARAAPDQVTLASSAMPVAQPHKTDVDPRRTFPITPTPPESVNTQEVTTARTRVGDPAVAPSAPPSSPPEAMRALSASEDASLALAAMQPRRNEYDQLVGQTLDGRYYVERKLGEGGMGVVFAARHAVIERPLAIKVLKREVMRDTATIRRFVQEAQAASRIGHPNIVDVTDFGTTPDGMTYSVMEYVPGHTLGTALRESAPFSARRAIRIAVQIARALGAAHDKGIVHRDLKPENVFLLDRDGRPDFVKIVDFGIAKVLPVSGASGGNEPRLTRAGSVFGTPEYMAPEQAAGKSDTDGRVDVYALGIILYEMLTGRVPHRGESTVRTLAMQMLDPVIPPSEVRADGEISPELEQVVLRALAKKREARYQTMGELLGALEKLQVPVGVSVTGSPVYALQPLPPGADPGLADSVPPMTPSSVPPGPVRTKAPTTPHRRLRDEPEFVTRDKPATFEHVFTSELPEQRSRRWPLLLLLAMIAGGAAGAIALVVKSRDHALEDSRRDPIVQPVPADAAASPSLEPDAQVVAQVPPADAAPDIVIVEADAGLRRPPRTRDAGTAAVAIPTPNGRGTFGIQIITKPEGANLYVGHTYRGPGGTTIEESPGTKLEVQCRLRGYKPGTLSLVFDGKTEYALCVLERIKICIDGIKNPFDDCEPAPGSQP